MRGADVSQPALCITKTVEDFVPKEHPLRAIRKLVDQALAQLDGRFERLYADEGRTSIDPEQLIRASLLQVLFTIRSGRQLVENRHHLIVDTQVEPKASVHERDAPLTGFITPSLHPIES